MALEWSGRLTAYDTPSIDGWAINAHAGDTPPHTSLPLPLKFQRMTAGGHDNAEVGLANIQRVWSVDGYMWGAGIFDDDDPAAVMLAGKVDKGLVNQISVDLYDCTVEPGVLAGTNVNLVTEWTMSSATLLADPKFHDARIALTSETADAVNASASVNNGVVTARAEGLNLTFAAGGPSISLSREQITITPPSPEPAPAPAPTAADRVAAAIAAMGAIHG